MRFLSLVLLGLTFFVSCSEEDHRIDLSYTGEQLRFVEAPIGGIDAGHMLINGDGSIRAFNIFGTPATDSQHSSVSFFSLYAAEEGKSAVVRILGKGHLKDSAGIAGGAGSTKGSVGTEGSGSLGITGGSRGSGNSEDSVGTEDSGEAVQNFEAVSGFIEAVFHNAFPLVQVDLLDDEVPLQVRMSALSPFIPIDTLNSNLPVAVFEWELTNPGKKPVSYSLALLMQNPLRTGGENRPFSLKEFIITPHSVSGWKGFTFSNGEDDPLLHDAGTVRVLSSSENTFYVPFLGDGQKALEQFWTDFSTDGKLESRNDIVGSLGEMESRNDIIGSSGRLEVRSNLVGPSGRIEPRNDKASSSSRTEPRGDEASPYGSLVKQGDNVKYSGENPEMAALYSSGVLDPGESITIPFLFSWFVPSATCFEGIDEITSYMVSGYKSLRDKTMQFSHSMITSTISPETLDTVLSGFADAVEQRGKNMQIIRNPFPYDGANGDSIEIDEGAYRDPIADGANGDPIDERTNGDPIDIGTKGDSIDEGTYEDPAADGENANPVDDKSAWDTYYSSSGFLYDKEARVMKFSPEKDVLPARFFWATDSGWGTINLSRARIVLDCIYGSLELKQLFLEGRSFFVFREFVPSQKADIAYDKETLLIIITEVLSLTEGASFTMEIP